jgi:iron complex outermembrane recepter protein
MRSYLRGGASVLVLAAGLAPFAARAEGPPSTSEVVVTGQMSRAQLDQLPLTTEGVSAEAAEATTDVSTVKDELKYLPDVLIRERHIGDTQAPITTRTSGVGSSARSLVYEDGVLVSALIGNNNTNASPRWDLINPDAVARTDVLYGPFAAAFPGNSIGEVVEVTTRTPDRFTASATAEGAWQDFGQYGTSNTYPTGRISGSVGDRVGRFSFLLSAFHLDTESQPLLYVTAATAAATSTAGLPVSGAYPSVSRTGAPLQILGAGGLEHQLEDDVDLKLAYDVTPTVQAVYTAGFYRNHDRSQVQSYLDNAAGQPAYAGTLNIAGHAYSVANSSFDNDLYHYEEDHLAQSVTLRHRTGGVFDWELIGSDYQYLEDRQRNPSGALPAAFSGGAGTITSLDDSGWYTLDAKGWWRPQGASGLNQLSFGLHADRFKLESPKYNTGDWIEGGVGSEASLAKGATQTDAVWGQDLLTFTPKLTLTLGGRYEHWNAYGGYNGAMAAGAVAGYAQAQPALAADAFSPKGVLAFTPSAPWRLTASIGRAYRFPTVEELYQAVTTGDQVSIPNPRLKPEDDVSEELAAERTWSGGGVERARLRLSLFEEHVDDALISQSAPLVAGSPTLYSYVQNVGRTRAKGVELVGEEHDLGLAGLSLNGWVTYVDSRIQADNAYAAAVGRQLPQLPRLRAAAVETYRPIPKLAFTVAERYSDRSFGTINNSDDVADTFTGFGSFFVVDVHAQYQMTRHILGDVGCDNINDREYFLYHPFPQRTVVATLKYRY